MSVIQGVVQQIAHRPTARGSATNIKVANSWYGCGFDGFPHKEGDEVSFSATQNGNFFNVDMSSLRLIAQGTGQAPQQQQKQGGYQKRAGGGNQNTASKDKYWENKEARDVQVQASIQLQAARNAAIAVCSAALDKDILPVPVSNKTKAFDAFLALVDEVTDRYYAAVDEHKADYTPEQATRDDF